MVALGQELQTHNGGGRPREGLAPEAIGPTYALVEDPERGISPVESHTLQHARV